MNYLEAEKLLKAVHPKLFFAIEVFTSIIFLVAFPFGFIAGALWAGLRSGVIFGRRWE